MKNSTSQRPVESIVGSPVSLRYGGVQPANTSRGEMFGKEAPLWRFLTKFGGAANPLEPVSDTRVFETYPVLAMIALDWMLRDPRPGGRLPKYNPKRKKTFTISGWRHVCEKSSDAFRNRGLRDIVQWLNSAAHEPLPKKCDQDCLDACLCLLVALYLAERRDCLMVGDLQTGYIVVPHCSMLHAELDARCKLIGKVPSEWVQMFKMNFSDLRALGQST